MLVAWRRHGNDMDGSQLECAFADVSDAYESISDSGEYAADLVASESPVANALRTYAERLPE